MTTPQEFLNLFCSSRRSRATSTKLTANRLIPPWATTTTGRRQIAAAARAAASATHENNTNNIDPAGGEKLKPERLSRGLSDTLNTLGEETEGKDDKLCGREDGVVETEYFLSVSPVGNLRDDDRVTVSKGNENKKDKVGVLTGKTSKLNIFCRRFCRQTSETMTAGKHQKR